jgi:hypothetical protein
MFENQNLNYFKGVEFEIITNLNYCSCNVFLLLMIDVSLGWKTQNHFKKKENRKKRDVR